MGTMKEYKKWKKDNPILFGLLEEQRVLTARWYERISGAVPWEDGERERIDARNEELSLRIDHLIGAKEARELNERLEREFMHGDMV